MILVRAVQGKQTRSGLRPEYFINKYSIKYIYIN